MPKAEKDCMQSVTFSVTEIRGFGPGIITAIYEVLEHSIRPFSFQSVDICNVVSLCRCCPRPGFSNAELYGSGKREHIHNVGHQPASSTRGP